MRLVTLFCPSCPVCDADGLRNTRMLALDCSCTKCGWYYTSALKRAVLAALCRGQK